VANFQLFLKATGLTHACTAEAARDTLPTRDTLLHAAELLLLGNHMGKETGGRAAPC